MQRYFVEQLNSEIIGSDALHITKVMRMKSGDEVIVCSMGHCFLVELDLKDQKVHYTIQKELEHETSPEITLIQGLPKHPKGELISKYATLFGVSHIVFIPMHRSIAKPDNEANKLKRMQLIAKEAAELAHQFDVSKISFLSTLKEINWKTFDYILLADENEKTQTLPMAIPMIKDHDKIALIIGPEGGITDQERNYFSLLNAKFVSLGKNILPTELASLYGLVYLSLKNI